MGRLRNFLKGMLAGGASVAALAVVNRAVAREVPEPEMGALGGVEGTYDWEYGRIFYRSAGEESSGPIVFIHGVGAGARSFMWRRNFAPLSDQYRVYALDLLGFGYSDKPANVAYSCEIYEKLIADFLRDVVGRPAGIVAHGLSGAFAVKVADAEPELVDSLLLVSPNGAGNLSSRPGMTGAAFYSLLHSPVLGTSFYNTLTSERSIRDYAQDQLFYDPKFATPRLLAHYYAVSHLPGAHHAATAFFSGYLNTDIREPFARLKVPVTLAWGRQDESNPLPRGASLLALNSRARLEVFDRCRLMPQEEYSERFNWLVRDSFRNIKPLSNSSATTTGAQASRLQ